MIDLNSVSLSFGKRTILESVSIRIHPGELVCILGPSGAGKSVMLNLMAGAAVPTAGTVSIDDADLRSIPKQAIQMFRRRVGIVYQDRKLLSTRTVAENIAFPMEVNGMSDDEIASRVQELVKLLDLTACASALPESLSAGEAARTAIARAVAAKPLILLLDEPMRDLDPGMAETALLLFKDLQTKGSTVVVFTHDPAVAQKLNARTILMERGTVISDTKSPETAQPARKPLQRQPVPAPSEIAKTQVEAVERKRKVRITAIHSD